MRFVVPLKSEQLAWHTNDHKSLAVAEYGTLGVLMSADWANGIERFINTPPGHFLAGGALAGLVVKIFERVESLLTESSRFEISIWLVGLNTQDSWRRAFSAYIRTVCGDTSSKGRTLLVAFGTAVVSATMLHNGLTKWISSIAFNGLVFPHGIPLLVYMSLYLSQVNVAFLSIFLAEAIALPGKRPISAIARSMIAPIGRFMTIVVVASLVELHPRVSATLRFPQSMFASVEVVLRDFPIGIFGLTLLWCSIWLWLALISGLILHFARRFDLGFQWFNRKFDIEKRPLQCIGLIAGPITAVAYWSFVFLVA